MKQGEWSQGWIAGDFRNSMRTPFKSPISVGNSFLATLASLHFMSCHGDLILLAFYISRIKPWGSVDPHRTGSAHRGNLLQHANRSIPGPRIAGGVAGRRATPHPSWWSTQSLNHHAIQFGFHSSFHAKQFSPCRHVETTTTTIPTTPYRCMYIHKVRDGKI